MTHLLSLHCCYLVSGYVQLIPRPTSDICFVCKRTLNKKGFHCTKCDLRAHKMQQHGLFDSDICIDCRRWENLLFHVSFCIGNSSDTESFLLDNLPSIPSHNEAWKVFKDKGMHFGHLNVNKQLTFQSRRIKSTSIY